jgi:hypothetical protein
MPRKNPETVPTPEQEGEKSYFEARSEKIRASRSRLSETFEKPVEIKQEMRKQCDLHLEKEKTDREVKYVTQEWWNSRESQIRAKGFDFENQDKGYRYRMATEMHAFDDLEKEFPETNERINEVYDLKEGIQEAKISLTTQLLTANVLYKRRERLGEELKQEKDEAKKSVLLKEYTELHGLVQGMAENISGRDFSKESKEASAQRKDLQMESEQAFSLTRLQSRFENLLQQAQLMQEIQEDVIKKFRPEKKGFIRRRTIMKGMNGEIVKNDKGEAMNFANKKAIEDFYSEKIREEVSRRAAEEVKKEYLEEKSKKLDAKTVFEQGFVDQQIESVAGVKGQEAITKERFDNLYKEQINKEIERVKARQGEKREKPQNKKENPVKRERVDLSKFGEILKDVKVVGEASKDIPLACEAFKEETGMDIDPRVLLKYMKDIEGQRKISYTEQFKNRSFLSLFFDILFGFFEDQEAEKKRRTTKK